MRSARASTAVSDLVSALLACVAVAGVSAACVRPPVGPPPPPPPAQGRIGPLAFETFVQDRPAIAGKWYDYNVDGHTLDPKPQAWVLSDHSTGVARYAAFRIASIYEPDTGDSGLFTLEIARFDAASSAWSPLQTFTASRNVTKTETPACVDLFGGASATAAVDVDCAGDAWQVRCETFQYFSPLAGITVADPGLFVRSVDGTDAFGSVKIARVDDVTSLDAVAAAVPDPAALPALDDAAPAAWDAASTEWDYAKLGADLPRAGMAIGDRFGSDDVWFMMTTRYDVVRFSAQAANAGIAFTWTSLPVTFADGSLADAFPATATHEVPFPAIGAATYLTFKSADLAVAADDTAGATFPYARPKTTKWDLAIERVADGDVRILVSPSAAVLNATELGLDETLPPVDQTQ